MKKIINKIFKLDKKLSREVLGKIKSYEASIKSKKTNNNCINVYAFQEKNEVYLSSGNETFYFDCQGASNPYIGFMDFAAWIFLPIAMVKNKSLMIHGQGTIQTKKNAERLSDVWACWLPKKYSLVNVDFSQYRDMESHEEKKQLLLFSGGVDSTYTILNKNFQEKPDLLTIQGMDYKISDQDRFEKAIEKTDILAVEYANKRITVRSNAFDIYKTFKIAPRLSFVFLLSSVSFLFIKKYRDVTMAADFSLYQQFEALPYGSSIATDQLYDSGDFRIESYGNDVTRAEKLPSILANELALQSLSLCKDKKVRPENCGTCYQCIRIKYMMLATNGKIFNECFINPSLDQSLKIDRSIGGDKQDAHIKSTYTAGFRNGNLDKIPNIVSEYMRITS
ncbi:MAG: hypothetical protein ACI910_001772 [Oleispira sp.]|jgi:hypothetical protein